MINKRYYSPKVIYMQFALTRDYNASENIYVQLKLLT